MRFTGLLTSLLVLFALSSAALAENGVTDKEIKVGITIDMSSLIKEAGTNIVLGIRAALERANRQGGVYGRKIKFIALDDAYSPPKAVANVKKLNEEEKVFALIGDSGSSNLKAQMPYIVSNNVLLLFPASPSDIIRKPLKKTVFSIRPDYQQETNSLIQYLVKKENLKEIMVAVQDDNLGTSGLSALTHALADQGLKPSTAVHFPKTTTNFKAIAEEIAKNNPKAVYFAGTSEVIVDIAKELGRLDGKPAMIFTSNVGPVTVQDELASNVSNPIYVSSDTMMPTETSYSIIRDYQNDMKAVSATKLHTYSVQGYIAGRVFIEALKRAGKNLTRAKLITALESMKDTNIDGLKYSFSSTNHQGSDKPYLFRFEKGKLKSLAE